MATPTLQADYFDGRSARNQPVRLWLEQEQAVIAGALGERRYPVRQVRWPEPTRHGQRRALLPDGGVLSVAEAADWDEWVQQATGGRGLGRTFAQRWFSSWRRTMLALALLAGLFFSAWRWGLPWAADIVTAWVPPQVDTHLGDEAISQLGTVLLKPSTLSLQEQQAWRERLATFAAAQPGPAIPIELHFQDTGKSIGPNAFALPGGHIVVTDQLIELLRDQPDTVLGVLAHEIGHVRGRHGMRMLVRASLGSTLAAMMVGDVSGLMAGAPALLMSAEYSRQFEREADATARDWLINAGRSPRAMQVFFERIQGKYGKSRLLPIAFSSHPANEERMRFFDR
ncbi:Peptidase family M48 [Roseateles sp. YR242]|uniref:M48 family metallopeptidase n=1 Tax=Roseateles sp. YR242 TaxID=1855305 RepID=UPI0008CE5AB9|nr:M48 family metallopeptidase [Roseateles sp. YR242]SEL30504.1 Peptidase family M48 [Roseateles sp. YR242]